MIDKATNLLSDAKAAVADMFGESPNKSDGDKNQRTGTVLSADTSAYPGIDTNESSFPHSDRVLQTKQTTGEK